MFDFIRKTPPPPSRGYYTLFMDESGNVGIMDSQSNVQPAVTVDGNPLILAEQLADPAVAADTVKFYAKDVGGVAQPFAKLDDNTVHPIGLPRINWKGGTPGNPYIAGDTATARHNEIVMVQVEFPDVVTINLPVIVAGSAALRVGVRNLIDKKFDTPGFIVFSPDAGDAVEAQVAGQDAQFEDLPTGHIEFESDGVGRWNQVAIGGPGFVVAYP